MDKTIVDIETDEHLLHINKSDKKKIPVTGARLLLGYLGVFIIFMGVALLVPLLLLFFYPNELNYIWNFVAPAFGSIILGSALYFPCIYKRERAQLKKGEDSILLVAIWLVNTLIAAVPFMMFGFGFVQAIFEATSGLTTTGLTVTDVANASRLLLMYRGYLQFIGGVGLVLVLTATISDRYGLKLYSAEGHSDKLLPNIAKSARLILAIYSGYILLGTVLLSAFGMPVFDSLNHSIAALATGGFSTQAASIGAYNSVAIEVITVILMVLGFTNFLIHANLFRGKLKNVFTHSETIFSGIIVLIFLPLTVLNVMLKNDISFFSAFRTSFFNFFSAFTTAGFQTVDSLNGYFPVFSIFVMIIVMTIGGATGSTGGGIKQYRMVVLFKGIQWNFKSRLRKNNVIESHFVNYAGRYIEVTDEDVKKNHEFILMYLLLMIIGTLILTAYDFNVQDSLFEVASAFSSCGMSVGVTSYNAPKVVLLTLTAIMFLGRLEIFVVFTSVIKMRQFAQAKAHSIAKKKKYSKK